eukprot:7332587-Pyramimonas_sp.AAC.1
MHVCFARTCFDVKSGTPRPRTVLCLHCVPPTALLARMRQSCRDGAGVFLKRHRIPKDGAFFAVEDLNVGTEVTFYARTFHITGCDPFTRDFLCNSGVEVAPDFEAPQEPICAYRAHAHKVRTGD